MLKRMTITVLAHRPTCGVISPSSSVLVTRSTGAVLFSDVVSCDLFPPVGAQLGAGRKFLKSGNVLEGRRIGVHPERSASCSSQEGLVDVMRLQEAMKAETAVDEAIDSLLPGDTDLVEDGDEPAVKSKVRTGISNQCTFRFAL